MAAVLASTPPQRHPKTSISLPPPSPVRLPASLRLSRDNLHRCCRRRRIHSSPPPDFPLEQRICESLSILELMEAQAISPDPELLAALLKSCSDARSLRLGRVVHEKATLAGLDAHPLVANSLVLLYGRCGQLATARRLFDEMPDQNVVSWTTIISAYHQAGFPRDALDLYRLMIADGGVQPNAFTYSVSLNCCASVQDLELGIRIHEELVKGGYDDDNFIVVALIDMYAKCGRLGDARKVFDRVRKPSVEVSTAMIEGCNSNGEAKMAMDVMRMMLQNGVSSEAARKLGFASMIRSCAMVSALRQGQEIHAHVIKFGQQPGLKALRALIELYEKGDKMVAAKQIFDSLSIEDSELWTTMISGFVRNRLYRDALKLYVEMASLGIRLNPLIISLVIRACLVISGLEEGKQIHSIVVKSVHLLDDRVISSLVELYRCCGTHVEAQKLEKN